MRTIVAILFSLLLVGTQGAFTTCSTGTAQGGTCLHCACGSSSGNCCVEQSAPNSASSPLVPVSVSAQDGTWLCPALARLLAEPGKSSLHLSAPQGVRLNSEIVPVYQRNCSYLI